MREFEFTVANGQVTGESRVEGAAVTPVHIPSDATFSIGTDTITETLKTDHGTRVLDFSQDASDPKVYDLVKTSWNPSQGAGDHHGSGGHGWSGDGDGSGHSWGGGHGSGAINPGGPIDASGVGEPVSAHGPGPVQLPGETWGGGHGLGAINPGGPIDASGVSDPVSAHGPGPVQLPGETWGGGHGSNVTPAVPAHPEPAEPPALETHIAEMHAAGGSLI